jgi:hypothetical protein
LFCNPVGAKSIFLLPRILRYFLHGLHHWISGGRRSQKMVAFFRNQPTALVAYSTGS